MAYRVRFRLAVSFRSLVQPLEFRSAIECAIDARAAIARGELLSAYDLCEKGLAEHTSDPTLKYLAVLALAPFGATRQARHRYQTGGLSVGEDGPLHNSWTSMWPHEPSESP